MDSNNSEIYKELQPGTELADGKYVIEKKIGEGGFGITYRAMQNGLNRTVCIKEYFLAGRCVRNTYTRTIQLQGINETMFEKYRQAFVREAKTLAALRHPNIVEVIDVFDENNTSYMVMPFLEGRSLQNIVEKDGPLSVPDAINYIGQITNAVGYIHERHILHRDIKPDNIMITAGANAILIDFGSAREFEENKTQAQTSMLTHGYAPTEQYTRLSRKGSYTDIYAIGATLYFVLTGTAPLEAAARMTEKMPDPIELRPDIPEEINRTILKAMQLKAENRHQNIKEFMDDLLNIHASTLIDESIGGKTVVIEKTKKWMWWAIGAAAVVIAILGVWLALRPKVKEGIVVAKTKDFTGMNIYPMVWVEGGTYTMGSSEQNEKDDDCPEHKVTLDGFWIGQFEVSQGFWKKVMGTGSNPSAYQPTHRSDGKVVTQEERDLCPVENIGHDDAVSFVRKLNALTGKTFALPSEAQWEYAARGGNKSKGGKYANGELVPREIWFDKGFPIRANAETVSNELGIFHMSGNVAEWCQDFYDAEFYETSHNTTNPVNKNNAKYFVVRGGSYMDEEPSEVNVYRRDADDTSQKYIGLRLVINNK